jgi:hypothetical protein
LAKIGKIREFVNAGGELPAERNAKITSNRVMLYKVADLISRILRNRQNHDLTFLHCV